MPGAGKTSVGRALAQRLRLPFADTDELLEGRYGSISKIFEISGEEGFRVLERELVRELSPRDGLVIAAGGGLMLSAENRALLRKNGLFLLLEASRETLLLRLAGDETRPLLAGRKEEKLDALLRARMPLYEGCADLRFGTDGREIGEIAAEIAAEVTK